MKNKAFYSRILAVSLILGQITPVAEAFTTDSYIPTVPMESSYSLTALLEEKSNSLSALLEDSSTQGQNTEMETLEAQDETVENWSEVAVTDWYDDDTSLDSFTIGTAEDLAGLAELVNEGTDFSGKTVVLDADVNLGAYQWTAIGAYHADSTTEFKGTFDGQMNTISNMKIASESSQQGLFYMIPEGAVLKNLQMVGASVKGKAIVGVLSALNQGTILNCYVTGTVEATDLVTDNDHSYAGGLVGKTTKSSATVANCAFIGEVKAISVVGGLVGYNGGALKNSYSYATVTATAAENGYAGALVGEDASSLYSLYHKDGEVAIGNQTGNWPTFDHEGNITSGESVKLYTKLNEWVSGQDISAGYYLWNEGDMPSFAALPAHDWTYTVDGKTITATCAVFGDEVVLTAEDLTYEGKNLSLDDCYSISSDDVTAEEAAALFADITVGEDVTLRDAGTYTLTITGADETAYSVSFDVEQYKIPLTDISNDVARFTYNGSHQAPTFYAKGVGEDGTLTLASILKQNTVEITESKEIGTYFADAVLTSAQEKNYILGGGYSVGYTIEEVQVFTVDFDSDGGTEIQSQSITEGEKSTKPTTDPTKSGYTFAGWYSNEALTEVWDFSKVIENNMTIYAKWTKITYYYTVTYQSNGGTSVSGHSSVVEGSSISRPSNPAKSGYTFDAWYKDSALTQAWNFSTDKVMSNTILYAKWNENEPDPVYTVVFDSNGGTSVATQVLESDYYLLDPESPYLYDYNFMGWYSDEDLLEPWDFVNYIVQSNMTLYAKWEKVVYYTSGYVFDYNGNPMTGTVVTLNQNGLQQYYCAVNVDGLYQFADPTPGVYNLTFTYGNKQKTFLVEIIYGDNGIPDVTMPENQIATSVSISSDSNVLAVGGVNESAHYLTMGLDYYDVASVEAVVNHFISNGDLEFLRSIINPYDHFIDSFDASVWKTINGESSLVSTTPTHLEIALALPKEYQGDDSIKVYRLHDDTLDVLTQTVSNLGEYIYFNADRTELRIVTRNFSTYAVTVTKNDRYDADSGSTDNDSSTGSGSNTATNEETRIYNIRTNTLLNGNPLVSSHMGTVSYSTSFPVYGTTVVIKPEASYGFEVDYVTAVTEAGVTLPVSREADGNYRYTQGNSPVIVTVAFMESKKQTSTVIFKDVSPDDSFFEAVNRVVDSGLMMGTGDYQFSPHESVTRGMLVAVLYQLSGDYHTGESLFWDIFPSDYYATAVAWGAETGIVMGYENGSFRPNDPVTREELAVIFYSYWKYKGNVAQSWYYPTEYKDNYSISAWAKDAVTWSMNEGILGPRYELLFLPSSMATRAEVAVSLIPLM